MDTVSSLWKGTFNDTPRHVVVQTSMRPQLETVSGILPTQQVPDKGRGTMYTEQLSQGLSISVAPIHPQTLNNGNLTTCGEDMSKFRRLLALLDIGAVTNGGYLTATPEESSTH